MKFLNILLGTAAAGSALAAPTCDAPTPTKDKRAGKFKYVGVNQSGAEFGKDTLPGQLGKHYTWPVKSTIDVSCCPCPASSRVRHGREPEGKSRY
jgi:endoglucanase